MKLWRCDWVPSSVADWLSRELEDRGIPGTTYTHTLLSLLHPYFCPHPVPRDPFNTSNCSIETEGIQSVLFSSGLPGGIKGFFEELQDYVHPDADFPDLNIKDHLTEGTRRSKKRLKRKLQDLTCSPEKLWKVAALQCLLTSSDEHQELNLIIEELFQRLKVTDKDCFLKEEKFNKSAERQLLVVHYSDCNNDPSPNTLHSDTTYSSDFPPLSQLPETTLFHNETTIDWKSLIKTKLSSPTKVLHSQPTKTVEDVKRNLASAFTEIGNKSSKLEMDTDPENINKARSLGNKTLCLVPASSDSYCSYSSKDTLHENNIPGFMPILMDTESNEPECDNIVSKIRDKLEEWECAADVLSSSGNRAASVDLLGFRLFERSMESACTTRSNSVVGFSSFEEERLKYVDVASAKVWGCVSDTLAMTDPISLENVWHDQEAYLCRQHATINSSISFMADQNLNTNNENSNSFGYVNSRFSFHNRSWSGYDEWDSAAMFDSKNDSLFSSAFHCSPNTASRDGSRQDFKVSLSDTSNESIKNIWSDLNDNDVRSYKDSNFQNGRRIALRKDVSLHGDLSETKICDSFEQLGLGQIWQKNTSLDNRIDSLVLPENGNSDGSSSVKILEHVSRNLDIDGHNMFAPINLCDKNISPTDELENKLVLANLTSRPSGPYIDLKHNEASGFSTVVPHKESEEVGELALLDIERAFTPVGAANELVDPEEENLLTSPRTHFKPIRQDRRGSIFEDKFDESQAILNAASGIKDAKLIYQRTPSGTLFLEDDTGDGSISKYMPYRDPLWKPSHSLDLGNRQEIETSQLESSIYDDLFVPKFKLIDNTKFCQTEEENLAVVSKNLNEELEIQKLQKADHNTQQNNFSEALWESKYPKCMKLIWENEHNISNKEEWELEATTQATSFVKWSTDDLDLKTTNWTPNNISQHSFCDSLSKTVGNQTFCGFSEKNEVDDSSISKIKFIWHDSLKKSSRSPVQSPIAISSSMCTIEKFPQKSWDSQISSFGMSDQNTRDNKIDLSVVNNPWNIDVDLQKQSITTDNGSNLSCYEKSEHTPLWQLQWEVDQEADEILGKLIPTTPLRASPTYLEESGVENQVEVEGFNFMEFLERQEHQHPVEDLDNLEPGWDLNEGFEWLPSTEQVDGEEEREVLFYKNKDGQTLMVPVEYLDDTLYDEIFGSDNNPIGGSLPDLPQVGDWKKLSRRAHGGRFVPPSRRPCSFFLEGNCRRSDCKFSHDLLTITCRFWEEGSCLKGETCPFRHGFLPSRRRNRSEGDQQSVISRFSSNKDGLNGSKGKAISKRIRGSVISVSSFELDSETDFPCLGSSVESKGEVFEENNFASKVKVTKLSKKKKKSVVVSKSNYTNTDGELKTNASTKLRKAERRKSKHFKNQTLSDFVAPEDLESSNLVSAGIEKPESESLKKIMRKRAFLPHQLYSFDDGTVSDF